MGLAFGDAFDFRSTDGVALVLVFGLLCTNAVDSAQKISDLRLIGLGNLVDLAFAISVLSNTNTGSKQKPR